MSLLSCRVQGSGSRTFEPLLAHRTALWLTAIICSHLVDRLAVVSEILERGVSVTLTSFVFRWTLAPIASDYQLWSIQRPESKGCFISLINYDSILLDKCLLLLIFAIMIVMPHCLRH